ncbi:MAG: BMC domain-containing protein [Clostridia bacterium]|nr:BMC domain-containing protein [Clostridia bacterium]MBQ2237429.1 BMC domain-containing protein [Clostridia bacterium]MEE1184798.1 BMC domain-containing protein [Acutalibacteraceae bacterium]
MGKATGIVEVFGLVTAFVACDAGCKAANVTVECFDKNKPGNADELEVPLIVAIKFRGSVDAVEAAVEAAKIAAQQVSGVVTSHILTSTEPDTEPMLKLNAFDKN